MEENGIGVKAEVESIVAIGGGHCGFCGVEPGA